MSNTFNDIIMENIGDDVAELTTTQIAEELELPIDALGLKAFGDTPQPIEGNEILYTGMDIFTYDELSEQLCTKRLEEYPDGPQ
jgi:hypothetical protein|tara:strand:+ start:244 stop:495 length:252 start_codon:yes stop_codon:yes gene_type:complete